MKKLLALLLSMSMLALPALAAEDVPATPGEPLEQTAQGDVMPIAEGPQVQPIAPWAYDAMTECAALGIWDDSYYYCILDPVTDEQMDKLTGMVADKLALLELPKREAAGEALVVDQTRGGVINALYQELAAYELEGVEAGPVETLAGLGVVQGDENGVAADRVCTLQEALVMAQRLVLNVYDGQGAGAKGLLWKAEGNGNTLYLLGTIHVDRDNIYPLHKSVRNAILSSDEVALEVDFTDEADMARYQALLVYDDGTTLSDHISPELYEAVSQVLLGLGMTQEEIDAYRPWVLAGTLQQLGLSDDSTGAAPLAPDLYAQSKAVNNGITLTAVESATFQVEHIFNALSDEYQEAYLAAGMEVYQSGTGGEATEDGTETVAVIAAMMDAWKDRDVAAFEAVYDKDAILENTEDELNSKMFTERDPNMIAWADTYLKQDDGAHTGFMAVGAGHMVGQTGIVQGLKDLGYTVELVPAE